MKFEWSFDIVLVSLFYMLLLNKSGGFQLGTQTFDTAGMIFGLQPTREYVQGSQPEWLHMQVRNSFDRAKHDLTAQR